MITSVITVVMVIIGMIFMSISLAGLATYPDFFTRLHVQGVGDTLGAFIIIFAMMVQTGFHLLTLKTLLVFIMIMLTNPLGTNLIMTAAINANDYQEYVEAKRKALNKENTEN